MPRRPDRRHVGREATGRRPTDYESVSWGGTCQGCGRKKVRTQGVTYMGGSYTFNLCRECRKPKNVVDIRPRLAAGRR